MNIHQYLAQLNTRFKSGISREHSYRTDLESLIRELVQGVEITNEPANVTDCGNPDYVITRKKIPIGYIEAKDIDKDLKNKTYKEQFDRYKKALDNLVITNYLWFQFFQNGELIHEIRIGEIEGNKIIPLTDNFALFETLIKDFCTFVGQTIKSSKKLAEMMAAKARLLENILERAVTSDEENSENSSLKSQYETFKQILIHDLTPKGFADIYAQTLAYGMFAARLHDPSLENFSRQEAAELIPKTNPFLRKLFQYVAGFDIDERIKTTVDNLAEVFRATDVNALLHNFGKSTQTNDPIIHFYETFLSEYDPKLRKSRGVWYTPEPVVKFIVRAVDDILKTEFNLPDGIADTSKTKIKVKDFAKATADLRSKTRQIEREVEVHKVQILDPATGTGTFLAEVVKHIYSNRFQTMQGAWSGYVEEHLIPRLNGFEILMASYSMAHLKLDMLLTETGYKYSPPGFGGVPGGRGGQQRFNIYLTNSLEEHHPDTGTLFANWLSSEANEANHIKRDTPVMVVMGNPPYSVSSSNKSAWIENLVADYKKDLNERNIQPLSDDYIKFIRFGQHFIEKNGEGILAYISNNSFIDGIIHRQMRKHLLESFDSIYILDLHGNSKKQEVCPDGTTDENVFDIMQGVSINIFVKKGAKKKNELGQILHFDLFGKREFKNDFLNQNSIQKLNWNILEGLNPNYLFVKKDLKISSKYNNGFSLDVIWNKTNTGVETGKDIFFISDDKNELINRFENINQETINKFQIKDGSSFRFLTNLQKSSYSRSNIQRYLSKPFDFKFCYYDPKILRRASFEIQKELIQKKNIAIICKRGRLLGNNDVYSHISICNIVTDKNFLADQSYIFPLYLYPETNAQQTIGQTTTPVFDHPSKGEIRTPNLNPEIVKQLAEKLGLTFVPEKEPEGNVCFVNNAEVRPDFRTTFAPIDILDYIYAVLHSPTYREKYKEFLKIDFPRVPFPKDAETFWQLVELGGELRQIHLLESPRVNQFITSYPVDGDNTVGKVHFQNSPPSEGWSETGVVETPSEGWSETGVVETPSEGCPETGVVETPSEGWSETGVVETHDQIVFIKKIKIILNPILELPYNPKLKQRAKELRQAGNLPEVLFWMQVTKGGFHKIDFDRQRIIGNYIVDFYVKKLGLVVEIDGVSHVGKEDYDREREDYLISLGLRVYRIKVEDVMQRLPEVMKALEEYIIEEYEPPRLSGTPPEEGNGLLNSPPLEGCPQDGVVETPLEGCPQDGVVGRVYINDTQYFDNVPEIAWNFYIGGYQPAQKWLKDRKGRTLNFEDILHYQKIIVALTETHRLMQEVDKTGVE